MLFRAPFYCTILSMVDIVVLLQINLDLTDWANESRNKAVLRHDCLHITPWFEDEENLHKIISYCLSEWSSTWNIQKDDRNQEFTFDELAKRNITSYHLYLWSAPIDTVENYQFYLDQLSTLGEIPVTMQSFYNCTLPRFGPMCQYSFDDHQVDHSSLTNIIFNSFRNSRYERRNQTCYTHSQCDIGLSTVCIDWFNICDGTIQCIGGIDEEHCWELEINQCKEDEYRCKNGQCIPMTFFHDNDVIFDCLDGSDEIISDFEELKQVKRRFQDEDFSCLTLTVVSQKISKNFIYGCNDTYVATFKDLIFTEIPDTMPRLCWLAVNCYFSFDKSVISNCDKICSSEICKKLINEHCPPMFYMPSVPVAFGHIYVTYTKEYILRQRGYTDEPQYVCYDAQLCGGFLPNRTTILFNKTTCRRPQDFPLDYMFSSPHDRWIDKYILPIHRQLSQCNTIRLNNSEFCDESTMYRCANSKKCIAKVRLLDNITDCDYGEDEEQISIDSIRSEQLAQTHFNCPYTKNYISRKLIEDGRCHCPDDTYDIYTCADEDTRNRYKREHLSFPEICDNFTHLIPISTNGTFETDETDCVQWPCNNTYTRCDGIWNCWNGADEVDCHSTSVIHCPIHNHVCISLETMNLRCLPIDKTNDGQIDCLGATDERSACQHWAHNVLNHQFYCQGVDGVNCLRSDLLCNRVNNCIDRDDERLCNTIPRVNGLSHYCRSYQSILSDKNQFLCNLFLSNIHAQSIYFSLDVAGKSRGNTTNRNNPRALATLSMGEITSQYRCHRSINLRVWTDPAKNVSTITCLCTPNYYGDRCQYQSERVSLTVQFRAFSDSWQTPFIIVVMLIDDSDERIIHSYEQFTYLFIKNCKKKFNFVLLYAIQPKNQSKQYSVHIDIYERSILSYRGSLFVPIRFPFLPVERIAVKLDIPPTSKTFQSCFDQQCVHGQCIRYFDQPLNNTFCKCDEQWSGRYCNISHTCNCASGSICLGVVANNRSLCICPTHKWGPRCLLHEQACQSNTVCRNNGRCMPLERSDISNRSFTCICPQRFTGERCEIPSNELILTFHTDIILPQWMFVHFVEVKENALPENGTTFKTIPVNRNSVIIYWPRPFHIAFVEFHPNNYYLITVQMIYNQSAKLEKTVIPTDHCPPISEVFNDSFAEVPLIRRIKHYHTPCQNHTPQLSCFYDERHLCLCYEFGGRRLANCFEFNHTLKRNCRDQSKCENGAQCLQDRINCPAISMCICPSCYYGVLCQFDTNVFGLSLDAILGDLIQPHVSITDQPAIVQISLTMTVIITVLGVLNGILSIMTFMNEEPKKMGCGFYLFGSSITTLFTMILFSFKSSILLAAQMSEMTNRPFLYFQCRSLDFLLRVGLHTDQWLNACVAIERAITTIKGINFDKRKSITIAKFTIPVLFCLTIGTNIFETIDRRLIDDDSNDQKRIWCAVIYSQNTQTFNTVMNILHFCIPFLINFLSAIIIIIQTARLRTNINGRQTYWQVLFEQFQQHKHLIVTPLLLVILAVPRMIILFMSGCMKSTADSWLYLIGYFISFIPLMLTFIIFVLPSKMYKDEFYNTVRRCQRTLRARFRFFH